MHALLKFGVKLPDTVIRWTLIKLSPYSIEVLFDTLWYKKKAQTIHIVASFFFLQESPQYIYTLNVLHVFSEFQIFAVLHTLFK